MSARDIKLDPKNLLGFKIVAAGGAQTLHSPKIGGKGCPSISADVSPSENAGALRAKIGTKTD